MLGILISNVSCGKKSLNNLALISVLFKINLLSIEIISNSNFIKMTCIPGNQARRKWVEPGAHPRDKMSHRKAIIRKSFLRNDKQQTYVKGWFPDNFGETHFFHII